MMMVVVTVVTVALNGLAAAWQPGLITHLPMSPRQRTAVCESEWKLVRRARGVPCVRRSATATSCHLTSCRLAVLCALVCLHRLCGTRCVCFCVCLLPVHFKSMLKSQRNHSLRHTDTRLMINARNMIKLLKSKSQEPQEKWLF